MTMNKKRKGIVLSNTLEIIIAVIGIALLLFGLRYLYINAGSSQETESVKYLADKIEKIIDSQKEGTSINISLKGIHSLEKEYVLFAWSKSDKSRPDKCYFGSCICICQDGDCKKKSICRSVSVSKISLLENDIVKMPTQFADRPVVYVDTPSTKNNIALPSKILVLQFEKTSSEAKISHSTTKYLEFLEKEK